MSWFVYRSPFNDFDNLGRVIECIRARKDVPYIRVFPGNAEHWFWSLSIPFRVRVRLVMCFGGDRAISPVNIRGYQ